MKHVGKCKPQKHFVSWPVPCSGAATLWVMASSRNQRGAAAVRGEVRLVTLPAAPDQRSDGGNLRKVYGTHDII